MPDEIPKILEKTYTVTAAEAIHFMGDQALPVLSTPALLTWIELSCRENASPMLPPGSDTVGISVELKHLAATPVGAEVKVVSRLAKIEGRIYSFEAEAFDATEKIGEASHQRASVNVTKFTQRVKEKQQKLAVGK